MSVILVLAALLAGPTHEHCWHEFPASQWTQADAKCCHDGALKSCQGHGSFLSGCSRPQTFPYLDRDPETLRYDYDYGK